MAALFPHASTVYRLTPRLHSRALTANQIPKSPFALHHRISLLTFQSFPMSKLSPQVHPQTADQTLDEGDLPRPLRDIVSLFQSVDDPKAKYHQLLHYASQMPPLHPSFKTDANRVRGCVSQVWVRAYADPKDPSLVLFEADSDSVLTKGLAALLVKGLSGSAAEAVARVPVEFVQLLGLKQSLTPSRNNGFLNMLKLMQAKAAEIVNISPDAVSDGKAPILDGNRSSGVKEMGVSEQGGGPSGVNGNMALHEEDVINVKDFSLEVEEEELEGDEYVSGSGGGGRAERIRRRIEKELCPVMLELEDISHKHSGHAHMKGVSGQETHFNLRVVSKEFEGKSLVKRHRLIYDLLKEELKMGLHALSIVAKTPTEV